MDEDPHGYHVYDWKSDKSTDCSEDEGSFDVTLSGMASNHFLVESPDQISSLASEFMTQSPSTSKSTPASVHPALSSIFSETAAGPPRSSPNLSASPSRFLTPSGIPIEIPPGPYLTSQIPLASNPFAPALPLTTCDLVHATASMPISLTSVSQSGAFLSQHSTTAPDSMSPGPTLPQTLSLSADSDGMESENMDANSAISSEKVSTSGKGKRKDPVWSLFTEIQEITQGDPEARCIKNILKCNACGQIVSAKADRMRKHIATGCRPKSE